MDVKWRLRWLRDEYPDAMIETEQLGHEPGKWATFKATVAIPGGGRASGHGSETASDFGDYYEKAETKALGRALAALGYGTQFLPDDGEALADSPVDRPATRVEAPTPIRDRKAPASAPAYELLPITDRQLKFLWAIARDKGLSEEDVHSETLRLFEKTSVRDLSRGEASRLIDVLNGNRPDSAAGPTATFKKIPPGQTTDEPEPPDPNAWTVAWKRLRELGCVTQLQWQELTQKPWPGEDPQRAVSLYEAARKERDRAIDGVAGQDRYTR